MSVRYPIVLISDIGQGPCAIAGFVKHPNTIEDSTGSVKVSA